MDVTVKIGDACGGPAGDHLDWKEGEMMTTMRGVPQPRTRPRLRLHGAALLLGALLPLAVVACGGGAEKGSVTGTFTIDGGAYESDIWLDVKDGEESKYATVSAVDGRFELRDVDVGAYSLGTIIIEQMLVIDPTVTCTAPGFRIRPSSDNTALAVTGTTFTVTADKQITKDITVTCK